MAAHHVVNGTDLKTVQETLGHASLAITSIYVLLAKKAQKKILQSMFSSAVYWEEAPAMNQVRQTNYGERSCSN